MNNNKPRRHFIYFFDCSNCERKNCRTKIYEYAVRKICGVCRRPGAVNENQTKLFPLDNHLTNA